MTHTIEGTTISPGLAQGKLHLHRSLLGSIDAPDSIARDEVDEELSRLDVATEKIADDLLALATRNDDAPGAPLTVCGELARRSEHIPRLLQCGIREASVAPPLVPIIKEAIRAASCDPCTAPLTFPMGDSP